MVLQAQLQRETVKYLTCIEIFLGTKLLFLDELLFSCDKNGIAGLIYVDLNKFYRSGKS